MGTGPGSSPSGCLSGASANQRRGLLRGRFGATALATLVGALALSGLVAAHVIPLYAAGTVASQTTSPFEFINGANYTEVHTLGFETNTFPTATQVSVDVAGVGAEGAAGTYAFDTIEVESTVALATPWTLGLTVNTAFVGTGFNAFWISYCTQTPTGAVDSGQKLAFGINGVDPWVLYPPRCGGSEANLNLTVVGAGAVLNVPAGEAADTSVLFLSLLLSVQATGVATTTDAGLSLVATAT